MINHVKFLHPYLIIILFLINACFANQCLHADEPSQKGSLIVTYQTDTEGERLDRIRFWLKDEHNRQQLFPKGDAYVDDFNNQNRMIVIEDLLPGAYTLEFLVPNTDAYFSEIPIRQVVIAKGDVLKVDQQIKPKNNSKNAEHETEKITFLSSIQDTEEKNKKAEPSFFDVDLPDNSEQTIIDSEDKTTQNITRETEGAMGKLIVSFDTKFDPLLAKQIRFKLVDDCGNCTIHPEADKDTDIALAAGKMIILDNVPIGEYSLEFFVEDDAKQTLYASKAFHIVENKTKSMHRSLQEPTPPLDRPAASTESVDLGVAANIPTAIFHLKNEDRTKHWEGKGRLYTFKKLEPGTYFLAFESADPFFIPPEEVRIEVTKIGTNKIETLFQTQGKLKILTNVGYTKVTIEDINHQKASIKTEISETISSLYLPEGRYLLIFPKQDDVRVPPQPMEATIHALQTSEINAYFEIQPRKRNSK